ncbi:hypothetical protein ACEQPO_14180 [Bacillus sp. SL00103]
MQCLNCKTIQQVRRVSLLPYSDWRDNGNEFDLLVPGNILYLDEKVYNHQKYYITDIELDQVENVFAEKRLRPIMFIPSCW